MRQSIERAQSAVEIFFEQSQARVFRLGDISRLLEENRAKWGLPLSLTAKAFIGFLLEHGILTKADLRSEHYAAKETRFLSGNPSPYAVGLSLRHNAYLTSCQRPFPPRADRSDPEDGLHQL
jgi:hypothetical protein